MRRNGDTLSCSQEKEKEEGARKVEKNFGAEGVDVCVHTSLNELFSLLNKPTREPIHCTRGRHRARVWAGSKMSGGPWHRRRWCQIAKFDLLQQREMLVLQMLWRKHKAQMASRRDPDTKETGSGSRGQSTVDLPGGCRHG